MSRSESYQVAIIGSGAGDRPTHLGERPIPGKREFREGVKGQARCQIASILQSLGCTVTLIEKRRLLSDWDPFIGGFLAQALHSSEVSLHFRQEVDLQYPGGTAEEPSFPVEGGLTSINQKLNTQLFCRMLHCV